MNQIFISVGEQLFEFSSFDNWVNSAQRKFATAGVIGSEVLCIDAKHRVCLKGKEFMQAHDDKAFPVRVYRTLAETLPSDQSSLLGSNAIISQSDVHELANIAEAIGRASNPLPPVGYGAVFKNSALRLHALVKKMQAMPQ